MCSYQETLSPRFPSQICGTYLSNKRKEKKMSLLKERKKRKEKKGRKDRKEGRKERKEGRKEGRKRKKERTFITKVGPFLNKNLRQKSASVSHFPNAGERKPS